MVYQKNIEKWSDINKWLWLLNYKTAGQIRHHAFENSQPGRVELVVFLHEWHSTETYILLDKTLFLTTDCKDEFSEIETKINETIERVVKVER